VAVNHILSQIESITPEVDTLSRRLSPVPIRCRP